MAEYRMSREPSNRKVYIGDLPRDVRKDELEDACRKYGRVLDVWLARNPPGFAFVEFDDDRDASDAVHALDGEKLWGRRVRAEISTDRKRRRGGPKSDSKCYECNRFGHFARECRRRVGSRGGGSSGGRRDRSGSPSYRRRGSESPSQRSSRRSGSRSRRGDTSRSPSPRRARHSRSRSASPRRSHSPRRKRSSSPYVAKRRDDDRNGSYH